MEKMDKSERIRILADQLHDELSGLNTEQNEVIEIFRCVVGKLPGAIFDNENFEKNCLFRGVIRLYSEKEESTLSETSRRERTITFRFMKNNKAIINSWDYSGKELYNSSWANIIRLVAIRIKNVNVSMDKDSHLKIRQIAKVFRINEKEGRVRRWLKLLKI